MAPILSRLTALGGGGNGGFGFGRKKVRKIFTKYLHFTSPGSVDMSQYGEIIQVDIFGMSNGNSGSSGQPATCSGGCRGGAGGNGGSSGTATAHFNAPVSPITITIGNSYPTTISGPLGAPTYGTHNIPSQLTNTFDAYNITSGPSGSVNSGPRGYEGGSGAPGSGGFKFSLKSTPGEVTAPSISSISASNGNSGGPAPSNPGRTGGGGGAGGEGYGAGGGGGGGGAEDIGNFGGGGGGGAGSPGITIVKIRHY